MGPSGVDLVKRNAIVKVCGEARNKPPRMEGTRFRPRHHVTGAAEGTDHTDTIAIYRTPLKVAKEGSGSEVRGHTSDGDRIRTS